MIIGGILFILGLIVGSFLNSFLWRYEGKISLAGRSMCPKCKEKIAWYDNIPVISYLLLSGKCRKCKEPISMQYPLVELLTGMVFVAVGAASSSLLYFNNLLLDCSNLNTPELLIRSGGLLALLFAFSALILIAIYDFKYREIPNGFNLSFVISAFIYLLVTSLSYPQFWTRFSENVLSGFAAFLFFYAFVYFSKETWMGGGDAKLAFGIGLLLGPVNTFLAILLSTWIGSIYGVGVLIAKRNEKKGKKKNHEIPFGPFLALGTLISFLFGSQLIAWYAKIFLGY